MGYENVEKFSIVHITYGNLVPTPSTPSSDRGERDLAGVPVTGGRLGGGHSVDVGIFFDAGRWAKPSH